MITKRRRRGLRKSKNRTNGKPKLKVPPSAGQLRLLVATDVLGRGIDIPEVSHAPASDAEADADTVVTVSAFPNFTRMESCGKHAVKCIQVETIRSLNPQPPPQPPQGRGQPPNPGAGASRGIWPKAPAPAQAAAPSARRPRAAARQRLPGVRPMELRPGKAHEHKTDYHRKTF